MAAGAFFPDAHPCDKSFASVKMALISLLGSGSLRKPLKGGGSARAAPGPLPAPLFGLVFATIRAGPASSEALRMCHEGSLQVEPFLEAREKILMKGAAFEVVPAPHPALAKGCEVV